MLVVALSLSSVAAFYSIVGLAAIFSGAAVPIIIMGSILEVAKLVVTVWLHEYWHRCRWVMKVYLVPAVGVLMLLTSMGIFGFLSKAHLDQAMPVGDIATKLEIIDQKIQAQQDNINSAKTVLKQLDDAVNQALGRGAGALPATATAAQQQAATAAALDPFNRTLVAVSSTSTPLTLYQMYAYPVDDVLFESCSEKAKL